MYISCAACGWTQDDFWGDHYNPVESLADWAESLIYDDIDKIYHNTNGGEYLPIRELIAQYCEEVAQKIRNMKYRTIDEYKLINPHGICPECRGKLKMVNPC